VVLIAKSELAPAIPAPAAKARIAPHARTIFLESNGDDALARRRHDEGQAVAHRGRGGSPRQLIAEPQLPDGVVTPALRRVLDHAGAAMAKTAVERDGYLPMSEVDCRQ